MPAPRSHFPRNFCAHRSPLWEQQIYHNGELWFEHGNLSYVGRMRSKLWMGSPPEVAPIQNIISPGFCYACYVLHTVYNLLCVLWLCLCCYVSLTFVWWLCMMSDLGWDGLGRGIADTWRESTNKQSNFRADFLARNFRPIWSLGCWINTTTYGFSNFWVMPCKTTYM